MNKLSFWLLANMLVLAGGPILHYIYLDRLLDYEYAAGIRTSTDGDIILIPVMGSFVFLFVTLLVVNVLAGCCVWLRRRGRLA